MVLLLSVLEAYGAVYRYGAPLDIRWLSAGWSAHFEFWYEDMLIRTDFLTRPPRLSSERLARLWKEQEHGTIPFLGLVDLIETKKTNREKDYAVIGELARLTSTVDEKLMYARSARDLIGLAEKYPDRFAQLKEKRPVLNTVSGGLEALEAALDAERRQLIHANEDRLRLFMTAAKAWAKTWPDLSQTLKGQPLGVAHGRILDYGRQLLPTKVPGGLG